MMQSSHVIQPTQVFFEKDASTFYPSLLGLLEENRALDDLVAATGATGLVRDMMESDSSDFENCIRVLRATTCLLHTGRLMASESTAADVRSERVRILDPSKEADKDKEVATLLSIVRDTMPNIRLVDHSMFILSAETADKSEHMTLVYRRQPDSTVTYGYVGRHGKLKMPKRKKDRSSPTASPPLERRQWGICDEESDEESFEDSDKESFDDSDEESFEDSVVFGGGVVVHEKHPPASIFLLFPFDSINALMDRLSAMFLKTFDKAIGERLADARHQRDTLKEIMCVNARMEANVKQASAQQQTLRAGCEAAIRENARLKLLLDANAQKKAEQELAMAEIKRGHEVIKQDLDHWIKVAASSSADVCQKQLLAQESSVECKRLEAELGRIDAEGKRFKRSIDAASGKVRDMRRTAGDVERRLIEVTGRRDAMADREKDALDAIVRLERSIAELDARASAARASIEENGALVMHVEAEMSAKSAAYHAQLERDVLELGRTSAELDRTSAELDRTSAELGRTRRTVAQQENELFILNGRLADMSRQKASVAELSDAMTREINETKRDSLDKIKRLVETSVDKMSGIVAAFERIGSAERKPLSIRGAAPAP